MKKLYFIFLCITFLVSSARAQRYDTNWLLGYGNKKSPTIFGRTLINFSNDTFNLSNNYGGYKFSMGFEANSFSDKTGKLRFFYDGFRLGNAIDYNIVENGDTLNPGVIWDLYNGGDYPISDGSFFIPSDLNDDLVYLIHASLDFYPNSAYVYTPQIYYSIIKMDENEGKGKVIQKNIPFLSGDITPMVVAACRHSNGHDWWIINKSNKNSTYYLTLFKANSPFYYTSQIIGNSVLDYSSVGNSVFSPNGKKFARISNLDGIQVFDFDRCQGILSNFIQVINDSIRNAFLVNIAISPDSRFLYALTSFQIYQYDLNSADINGSQEIIGEWDGFIYDKYFTTSFANMQLAPDNKIYVSCASGNIYLHTINKPNLKGMACDFQLRSLTVPTYIFVGLGNYPNYLLGAEEGSICDSLTQTNDLSSELNFSIYPNPSNGILQIVNQKSDNNLLEFHLIDISGNIIFKRNLLHFKKQWDFDFTFLNPGLYFVQLYIDHNLVQSSKWVLN